MAGDESLKTPLYDWHQAHGGRLVEFGGWSMPVQYSSILAEHAAVRQRVGLFDISHMGRLKFEGPDALAWLDLVTTNHVAKLTLGQIQYSLVLSELGGIFDDMLVYRRSDGYAVVCNASNRLKVIAQFEKYREGFDAHLVDETLDTVMIAVQGPAALATTQRHFDATLTDVPYYHGVSGTFLGVPSFASRTGYTGEDGFELIVPKEKAVDAWEALMDAGRVFGVLPIGLGARDTLRLEAAMPLYGHEMDESVDPYSVGIGWAVKLKKGVFVGRDEIRPFQAKPEAQRIGLALDGKRIARLGSTVKLEGKFLGIVTSGTFSPTLGLSLAMASVPFDSTKPGSSVTIDVRGQEETARVVPLPFYRRAASPA